MVDSLFLEDWKDTKIDGICADFTPYDDYSDQEPLSLEGINIIYAVYTYKNYHGDASIVYEDSGKLYEVGGSHCSCYGLEGQWKPQEITLEYLQHKLDNGYFFGDDWDEDAIIIDDAIKEHIRKYLKEIKND